MVFPPLSYYPHGMFLKGKGEVQLEHLPWVSRQLDGAHLGGGQGPGESSQDRIVSGSLDQDVVEEMAWELGLWGLIWARKGPGDQVPWRIQ